MVPKICWISHEKETPKTMVKRFAKTTRLEDGPTWRLGAQNLFQKEKGRERHPPGPETGQKKGEGERGTPQSRNVLEKKTQG